MCVCVCVCVCVRVCVCRNITLLHYLITILETKYPKVLLFQEELQCVPNAAKVKYVTTATRH